MQDNMSFFILVDNQQQGPYTLAELRSRNITSATLVWAEGMAQWTPAWQVEALQTLFAAGTAHAAGAPVPPPAQQAQQATQGGAQPHANQTFANQTFAEQAFAAHSGTAQAGTAQMQQPMQQQPSQQPPRHHLLRGGCMTVIVAVVLLAVALVATCPTPQDHREAVTRTLNQVVEHATDQGSGDAWGMIGSMITKRLVGVVVDQMLDVQSYGLWSVGTIHYKDTDKKVSFGILGHVYTFDADDIERALKQGGDQGGDTFHSPLYNPGSGDSDGDGGDDSDSQDNAPSYDTPGDDTPQAPSSPSSPSSPDGGDGTGDDGSADL